ncbi:MAG: (Fe-S)-binding protein [Limisphaerales bacterium]
MTVTLFIPCFVDALFPRAGISMVEILERLGHKVSYPKAIVCCGQPRSIPVIGMKRAPSP